MDYIVRFTGEGVDGMMVIVRGAQNGEEARLAAANDYKYDVADTEVVLAGDNLTLVNPGDAFYEDVDLRQQR